MITNIRPVGKPQSLQLSSLSWALIILFSLSLVGIPFVKVVHMIGQMRTSKRATKAVQESMEREFRDYIGKEPRFMDLSCTSNGTCLVGSAIAWDAGFFYIVDTGIGYTVPSDDVINWEGWARGPQEMKESGLFVDIKNIQKPRLQFTTRDANLIRKWAEILRQDWKKEIV